MPLLLLASAACGSLGPAPAPMPPNPGEVAQGPVASGKFVAFVGARIPHAEPFLGVSGTNYAVLRSWLDTRNGEAAYQLYVEDSYFGRARDWNAARDGQGQSLRFIPISKNEIQCDNGCSYAEEFAAALPEPLLRANPQGLTIVFTSRSGAEKRIVVSGDAIAKQLAAMDKARAGLPPAARAVPPRDSVPAATERKPGE